MTGLVISVEDPRNDDVRLLLDRHLTFTRETSPPEDVHALDLDGLVDLSVAFFTARIDGELMAVGAIKRLDATHAELKSMHTVEAARGRGLGKAMVEHLMEVARATGYERVSLETGSMESFAPARALYAKAGFVECEPFGDYRPSPNSTFMTRTL